MKIKLHKVFQNVCHFLLEISYYFFQYMVSLYNSNYPRTHSVEKAGLEPAEICLPMPPECWYFNTSRLEITFKYLYQIFCKLKYYYINNALNCGGNNKNYDFTKYYLNL